MDPEERIRQKAGELGARAVGFAGVEQINAIAPPGHRPDDLLPGARSVVVIGGAQPTAGAWRAGSNEALTQVGYNKAPLAAAARALAVHIEEIFGYLALPIPAGEKCGRYPFLSLKLCAEMAGLGTRSMAGGVVLNKEHGLLFFNGVITTLPLAAEGPLAEPVCPHPVCVRLWNRRQTTFCLASCPECLSGEIQGERIGWMEYRQDLCSHRAKTSSTDVFQKLLLEAVNEPDPEIRKAILFGSRFSHAVHFLTNAAGLLGQCYNCLKRCPLIKDWLRKWR